MAQNNTIGCWHALGLPHDTANICLVNEKSRLVKTKKIMANKALKFVGIKRENFHLIKSRWVLNMPARVIII